MNIAEALKIAKEQGKKVRPVGCTSQYIVYEDGAFWVKMTEIRCEYKLEIYSHAIEHLIFEDWEVVKEKNKQGNTVQNRQYEISDSEIL